MKRTLAKRALRFAAVIAAVCFITYANYRVLHVNQTTVGYMFLLVVLVVSAAWGLPYAVFTAISATVAYNFFFLPPLLRLTIADPQNWIALFAFLVTAVVASHLSERARREALQSTQRRQEVERLYSFSQQLLVTENVFELLNTIPRYIVEYFDVSGAAMFLESKHETYYSTVEMQTELTNEQLKSISSRGEPVLDREHSLCFMPLRMGVRTVGSIGMAGCTLSLETLEAIGSLAAIAIERANAVERLTRAEATRESDRLRSVLLDAVTHEFRTPLTAIKASAETLLSESDLHNPERKDLLTVIDEESDRLNRLIGEAAEVAQLDSRQVELRLEPHHIREAINAALQECRQALARHTIELNVPDELPKISMDVNRITEVVRQLLENAGKYSPPATPIHVTAELQNDELLTSIADHGSGIDEVEQSMIFERFYRGRNQRVSVQGTGMGLAIAKAIIELHHGSIRVTSQLGRGSVFSFSLPLAKR